MAAALNEVEDAEVEMNAAKAQYDAVVVEIEQWDEKRLAVKRVKANEAIEREA